MSGERNCGGAGAIAAAGPVVGGVTTTRLVDCPGCERCKPAPFPMTDRAVYVDVRDKYIDAPTPRMDRKG